MILHYYSGNSKLKLIVINKAYNNINYNTKIINFFFIKINYIYNINHSNLTFNSISTLTWLADAYIGVGLLLALSLTAPAYGS